MADGVRVPITNTLTKEDYTARISVGGRMVDVLLDTGSAALAVDSSVYTPEGDSGCRTTKIAQMVQYCSASWVGAVVQTVVGLSPEVALPNTSVALTYGTSSDIFGSANGILGLAYHVLDSGFMMPADTWASKYNASDIRAGRLADINPYFDQLEQAGLLAGKFAFLVKRSVMSGAREDPTADPLNAGIFVAGGGEECTDLYSGSFAWVAVADQKYYNVNLLAVQVGAQSPIVVPPPAPGSTLTSNAVVDSGTSGLRLDQGLYEKILGAVAAINAEFANTLMRYGVDAGNFIDQTQLDLLAWPSLTFVFQGSDGAPASVLVRPSDYWQFDAVQAGMAVAMLAGDNGKRGGQSILGLPLFTGHYVVFDRTASNGHGSIGFAAQA